LPDCSGPKKGYDCSGGTSTSITICKAICGDGIVVPPEVCDDGDQGSCLANCSGFAVVTNVISSTVSTTKSISYMTTGL